MCHTIEILLHNVAKTSHCFIAMKSTCDNFADMYNDNYVLLFFFTVMETK